MKKWYRGLSKAAQTLVVVALVAGFATLSVIAAWMVTKSTIVPGTISGTFLFTDALCEDCPEGGDASCLVNVTHDSDNTAGAVWLYPPLIVTCDNGAVAISNILVDGEQLVEEHQIPISVPGESVPVTWDWTTDGSLAKGETVDFEVTVTCQQAD